MKASDLDKKDLGIINGALSQLIDIIEQYPGWHPEKAAISRLRDVQFKIQNILKVKNERE